MRFAEIDLFGVYIAPLSLTLRRRLVRHDCTAPHRRPLRPAATRLAPGSVRICMYIIVLSSWILIVSQLSSS